MSPMEMMLAGLILAAFAAQVPKVSRLIEVISILAITAAAGFLVAAITQLYFFPKGLIVTVPSSLTALTVLTWAYSRMPSVGTW